MRISGKKLLPVVLGSSCGLTPRQKQVLQLSAEGLSRYQIAGLMGLRYYTVSEHLKQIYRKLGVHNRTAAVVLAIENGLIGTSAKHDATVSQRGGRQNQSRLASDFCPSCGHCLEAVAIHGRVKVRVVKRSMASALIA